MKYSRRYEFSNVETFSLGGRESLLPYMLVRDVPFFLVPFFEQKRNFRVSFLVESQVVINCRVSFEKITL